MVDLTKENFEEEVLKAEGTVLVDFYGDGCVPCQMCIRDRFGTDQRGH